MYKKILVPMALDHDVSHQTLELAQILIDTDGEIIALHVHEAPQESVRAYVDNDIIKAGYENAKARLAEKLSDLPNITPILITGHSARSIIDYADNHEIDCIVMGSHKPGLSDYFLGSTAARVVRHARCSVHVQRNPD